MPIVRTKRFRGFAPQDYRRKESYRQTAANTFDSWVREIDHTEITPFQEMKTYQNLEEFFSTKYTVTPRDFRSKTNRKSRYNDCDSTHTVLEVRPTEHEYIPIWGNIYGGPDRPVLLELGANPNRSARVHAHGLAVQDAQNSLSMITIAGIQPDWPALCDQAMMTLKPKLASIGIVADLVEIASTKTMFKNLLNARKVPAWVNREILNPDRVFATGNLSQKLRKVSKTYSEKFLEYSYGWAPLIGEVQGALSVFDENLARIFFWNANVASTLKTNAVLKKVKEKTSGVHIISGTRRVSWECSQEGTITASLTMRPQPVLEIDSLEGRYRRLIAGLGIEFNARIIWDLIPFSFCVDWFINTESFLDQFDIPSLELNFEMLDFCLNLKQRLVITTKYTDDEWSYAPSVDAPHNYQFISCTFPEVITTIETFQRLVTEPFLPSLVRLGWKRVSGNHLWLGFNLLNAIID